MRGGSRVHVVRQYFWIPSPRDPSPPPAKLLGNVISILFFWRRCGSVVWKNVLNTVGENRLEVFPNDAIRSSSKSLTLIAFPGQTNYALSKTQNVDPFFRANNGIWGCGEYSPRKISYKHRFLFRDISLILTYFVKHIFLKWRFYRL